MTAGAGTDAQVGPCTRNQHPPEDSKEIHSRCSPTWAAHSPEGQQLDHPLPVETTTDDPMNWSILHVAQHFCEFTQFSLMLREQEVNGSTLLLDVKADILEKDFDIKYLKDRAPILREIERMRAASTGFRRYIERHRSFFPSHYTLLNENYAGIYSCDEKKVRSAKRKRSPSPPIGSSRTQRQNDIQKPLSLFAAGSPFYASGCPEQLSIAVQNFDRLSHMPQAKLPMVAESCLRLDAMAAAPFQHHCYTAMVKTDPDEPELTVDQIAGLIEDVYAGDLEDVEPVKLSPEWTVLNGILRLRQHP